MSGASTSEIQRAKQHSMNMYYGPLLQLTKSYLNRRKDCFDQHKSCFDQHKSYYDQHKSCFDQNTKARRVEHHEDDRSSLYGADSLSIATCRRINILHLMTVEAAFLPVKAPLIAVQAANMQSKQWIISNTVLAGLVL